MARVSALPFEDVPENLQNIMRQYDEELGGSEFVQVFAHAPELYQSFIDFYFPLALEKRGGVDINITELARLLELTDLGLHLREPAQALRHERRGLRRPRQLGPLRSKQPPCGEAAASCEARKRDSSGDQPNRHNT